MNSKQYPDVIELLDNKAYRPCISLIFPFETKFGLTQELKHKLKTKSVEIEKKLLESHTPDQVKPLMHKLKILLDGLQPEMGHLGLALYLSPVFEKIVYLNFSPLDKLVIDESFEIRDLVRNQNEVSQAILLLLSANEIRYYLVSRGKLTKLNVDVSDRVEAFMANTLHDVAIHYEKSDRKDKAMHVFLENADQGLTLALRDYPHPVIIAGAEKLIGHFKQLTKNHAVIEDYIEGNYLESNPSELNQLATAAMEKIKSQQEERIVQQVEEALNNHQLARGLKEVWKQASDNNGRLLVVENNYTRQAGHGPEEDEIFTLSLDVVPFPMQDAVDDVIEKVILQGGRVEFVEDGKLGKYRKVALVMYHKVDNNL